MKTTANATRSSIRNARTMALAALPIAAMLAAPAAAVDVDSTWVGRPTGSWNAAGNWDPKGIPNNGADLYSVFIQSGALVTIDTSVTVSNLTLGLSDHLRIVNGRVLTLNGALGEGMIHNAGLLEVSSSGSVTRLDLVNDLVTLDGGGTVRLIGANAWVRRGNVGAALLNINNVIEGEGRIGWVSGAMPITNQHVIRANAAAALRLEPGSELFTNSGTLQAIDGGTLQLFGGEYANVGGTIEALDGSVVALDGSAVITGGLLDTAGTGEIAVTTNTPRIADLTNAGTISVTNGRALLGTGTLVNSGEIVINGVGSSTYFRPAQGALTLTGGGTVRFNDAANNWLYRDDAESTVVNLDNVIEGAGRLGWASQPTPITNHHIVRANATVPMRIEPGSSLFTNTGVLRAESGATLQLAGGTYLNDGGTIEALAGSTVQLDGPTVILGGTVATESDGEIVVTTSTPRLEDLTVDGSVRIVSGRTMLASGTINNLGEILIDSVGGATYLRPIDGELTLTGGGTVRMSDGVNNWIYRQDETGSLRNVDNVIEGAGNLGWSTSPTPITNEHVVRANLPTPLVIQPGSATFTNLGLLEATDGATLRLNSGTYANAGGTVRALAGSTVELNGSAVIAGGTLETTGDGVILVTTSTPRLENVVVNGALRIVSGRELHASGTLENTGEILIDSAGSATYLQSIGGELTLTGGGTVRMSDAANNWMYRADPVSSLRNLDNTIRGAGNIGWTSARTGFRNEGTVIGDGTVLLRIAPESDLGFVNEGLLVVQGAGGVEITGGIMDQRGTVQIDPTRTLSRVNGSYVQTGGVTTVQGTLAVSGTGAQLQLLGGVLSGDGVLSGPVVNSGGTVSPGLSIGTLSVNGTYGQSTLGTLAIEIDGPDAADADRLVISGAANLGGILSPLFDDGFTPMVGDEWTILTASPRNGSFNFVAPCERVRVIYDGNEVRLEYTGVLKVADLNCDGVVDGADLGLLLSNWGPCADPGNCPADLDGNGVVDGADLGILLSNWG